MCGDMEVLIRLETEADYREVENVTREAFWNVYSPGCVEHYLLHMMRQSPDFIHELDIVAEADGKIVGNAVCVRSYIEGDDGVRREVVCLGPVSVLPFWQRKGVGCKMIMRIVTEAQRLGYRLMVLTGDPLFYSRLGFEAAGKYGIRTCLGKISPALMVYPLNIADMKECQGRYFENPVYEADMALADDFDKMFPAKEKMVDTPTQLRLKELIMMEADLN